MNKKLSIAIVGAGMGGLAVAATLRRAGFDVQVYEQAARFAPHRRRHPDDAELDEGAARASASRSGCARPRSRRTRTSTAIGDTGEVMRELPMPESLYGAPYLCMHRGDLHDALASAVPAEIVHLGKKLVGLDQSGGQVTLALRRRHARPRPTP